HREIVCHVLAGRNAVTRRVVTPSTLEPSRDDRHGFSLQFRVSGARAGAPDRLHHALVTDREAPTTLTPVKRGGPMNAERYDLIVLGSGSAARDGAGKAAREHGDRVALMEHWLWGGSCPNVACRRATAYVVTA